MSIPPVCSRRIVPVPGGYGSNDDVLQVAVALNSSHAAESGYHPMVDSGSDCLIAGYHGGDT